MIEIRGLSKSFNGRVILDDINAKFQQGKTNMVIGVVVLVSRYY